MYERNESYSKLVKESIKQRLKNSLAIFSRSLWRESVDPNDLFFWSFCEKSFIFHWNYFNWISRSHAEWVMIFHMHCTLQTQDLNVFQIENDLWKKGKPEMFHDRLHIFIFSSSFLFLFLQIQKNNNAFATEWYSSRLWPNCVLFSHRNHDNVNFHAWVLLVCGCFRCIFYLHKFHITNSFQFNAKCSCAHWSDLLTMHRDSWVIPWMKCTSSQDSTVWLGWIWQVWTFKIEPKQARNKFDDDSFSGTRFSVGS